MIPASRAPEVDSKAGHPALRVVAVIEKIVAILASAVALAAISAIFLSLMADVIVRYFSTRGLGWPAEVPNLLFPWLIMGGIVLAAVRSAHIAVSIILYALPRPGARLLLAAMQVLIFASFAFLAYVSIDVVKITVRQVFPITGIPQFYAYSAMIFGFVGIAVIAATTFVRVLTMGDPLSVLQEGKEEFTT